MAVLYELLTNTRWGFGQDPASVNVANFRAAAEVLFTEGNGLSLLVDNPKEANDIVLEIERQMDGVLYLNHLTGLWEVKLFRNDYDIDAVPELNNANVLEVTDFTHGTWEETINQVRTPFNDRARNYTTRTGQATDLANQRIQLGALIPTTIQYPGCKTTDLAAKLAARQLRYLSTPLVAATIVVDRSLYALKPGDVVAWTDSDLGFSKLPMRIGKIDQGDFADGKITLSLCQDIFQFASPVEAADSDTLWTAPTQAVGAIPSTQELVEEAPYALVRRDPEYPGVLDRLMFTARHQDDAAISYRLFQRHSSGAPSGDYEEAGEAYEWVKIGHLRDPIYAHDANPTATVSVDGSPDSVADILSQFQAAPSASDLGQNLLNLIRIGNEFAIVTRAEDATSHLNLKDVYRGVLDSVPTDHLVNEPVFLLFVGAGLGSKAITRGHNVQAQLRPRSRDGEVTEGQAQTVALTMADRCRRPVPPIEMSINGSRFPTPSMDVMKAGGSTDDDRGMIFTFRRRDWRTFDEVQALGADASTFASDFPAANSTQYQVLLEGDPETAPYQIGLTPWADTASIFVSRTRMLWANAAIRETRMRAAIQARHTYQGQVFTSLQALDFSFNVAASELDGVDCMGAAPAGSWSDQYLVEGIGQNDYTFVFSKNVPVGGEIVIEIDGEVSHLLSPGQNAVTVEDIWGGIYIRIRYFNTIADTGEEVFMRMKDAANVTVAYGVFKY